MDMSNILGLIGSMATGYSQGGQQVGGASTNNPFAEFQKYLETRKTKEKQDFGNSAGKAAARAQQGSDFLQPPTVQPSAAGSTYQQPYQSQNSQAFGYQSNPQISMKPIEPLGEY